jgi:hypothetical protein
MRGPITPLPHTPSWRGDRLEISQGNPYLTLHTYIRGPFEKFVDWRQCAAVIQRETVTVMPSCSGGGNVVVA